MDPMVAGFWGAFFGTAALMLAGAVVAYAQSLRRVSLIAASASLLFVFFVAAFLGWLPLGEPGMRGHVLAVVFVGCSLPLGHLVLAMIGHMRDPAMGRRWRAMLYGGGIVIAGTSLLLPLPHALLLAVGLGLAIGGVALVLSIRRAQRGDRLAGLAIAGVVSVMTAASGLLWIASHDRVSTGLHAITAVASVCYLTVIAVVLWLRFSYLIELREVMAHGTAYDPITRMRTHSETGQMVGLAFFDQMEHGALVGVMAVSIGNLLALDKLHGAAAVNHGLFVSAGRLRRVLPGGIDAGRLGDDAFLVLMRDVDDVNKLIELGHDAVRTLSRPVALSTGPDPAQLESRRAYWEAQVGVGVVVADANLRPSEAIAEARRLSRAAWGFPSRVAWEDDSGQVAEAPDLASA